MPKKRVLVVEDSLTVRKRLVEVLSADPELEVVGLDELTVGYRTDHGSRAMAT